MTTSTIRSEPGCGRPAAGFTLVEILIGIALSTFVLAGILTSFLMLGRTGVNVAHYSVSESEIRRAMEEFSQDIRMARQIQWNSANSITLTVPDNYASTSNMVTYSFDSSSTGPTARCFYRVPGDASSTAAPQIHVRNVSQFEFSRFNRLNDPAITNAETKRIQIRMNVRYDRSTLVAANTTLISSSYTLRNKAIN
jgi:Tfp pilus assembly protein PilW